MNNLQKLDYNESDQLYPTTWEDIQYILWHICSPRSTGEAHLHGYVVFKRRKYISNLIKHSGDTHWELCKYDHKEAVEHIENCPHKLVGPWTAGTYSQVSSSLNLARAAMPFDEWLKTHSNVKPKGEKYSSIDNSMYDIWLKCHIRYKRFKHVNKKQKTSSS